MADVIDIHTRNVEAADGKISEVGEIFCMDCKSQTFRLSFDSEGQPSTVRCGNCRQAMDTLSWATSEPVT